MWQQTKATQTTHTSGKMSSISKCAGWWHKRLWFMGTSHTLSPLSLESYRFHREAKFGLGCVLPEPKWESPGFIYFSLLTVFRGLTVHKQSVGKWREGEGFHCFTTVCLSTFQGLPEENQVDQASGQPCYQEGQWKNKISCMPCFSTCWEKLCPQTPD
jgi:hypothetical protein